jgi:hypothetical protein
MSPIEHVLRQRLKNGGCCPFESCGSARAVEEAMLARLVIVTIAIAFLVVGTKLFLFPPKIAGAVSSQAGLDIQQMHKDKQKIPDQNWSDMSLVFDRNN